MKHFTIENETNNITVHGSAKEAEAVPDSERFSNEAGAGEAGRELARGPPGRDLEQPAGSDAGEEVQGSRDRRKPDLESNSEPRPDRSGKRRQRRFSEIEVPDANPGQLGIPAPVTPEPATAAPVAPQTPDVAPEAAPAKIKTATREEGAQSRH